MSYINTGGAISIGASLAGASQESLLYIDRSLRLAAGYPNLLFDDGSGPYPMGLGVGPVANAGATAVGLTAFQGLIHVEDPGATLQRSTFTTFTPGVYVQSRYRSPAIAIQSAIGYPLAGNSMVMGINAVPNDIGGVGQTDDVVFAQYSSPTSKFFRFGTWVKVSPSTFGAVLSVPTNPSNPAGVGIHNDSPLTTLHAGCGTRLPTTANTAIYATSFGNVAVAVSDNAAGTEIGMGSSGGTLFFGSATPTNINLRLNNANRGVIQPQGNFFLGSTAASSYMPETNIIGLTGFPSSALVMTGNRAADGSVAQVAAYNDAAGTGTQVGMLRWNRSGANNTSTADLQTMVAGVLGSRVFVDGTGKVGINQGSPQGALDVVSTTSGVILPRIAADPGAGVNGMAYYNTASGSFKGFQGGLWASFLTAIPGSGGAAGGIDGQVQFNTAGVLNGSTQFTWDNVNNALQLGNPVASQYFLDVRGTTDGICSYNNYVAGFGTTTFDENRVDLFNGAGTASWRIVGLGPWAPNGLTYGDVQFSRSATGRALFIPSDATNVPIAYMNGTSFGIMTSTPVPTLGVGGSGTVGVGNIFASAVQGSTNTIAVQGSVLIGSTQGFGIPASVGLMVKPGPNSTGQDCGNFTVVGGPGYTGALASSNLRTNGNAWFYADVVNSGAGNLATATWFAQTLTNTITNPLPIWIDGIRIGQTMTPGNSAGFGLFQNSGASQVSIYPSFSTSTAGMTLSGLKVASFSDASGIATINAGIYVDMLNLGQDPTVRINSLATRYSGYFSGASLVSMSNIGAGVTSPKATFHGTGTTVVGGLSNSSMPSNMGNSQINFWINESGNQLNFQVKYSTGVVKNGTVALS